MTIQSPMKLFLKCYYLFKIHYRILNCIILYHISCNTPMFLPHALKLWVSTINGLWNHIVGYNLHFKNEIEEDQTELLLTTIQNFVLLTGIGIYMYINKYKCMCVYILYVYTYEQICMHALSCNIKCIA